MQEGGLFSLAVGSHEIAFAGGLRVLIGPLAFELGDLWKSYLFMSHLLRALVPFRSFTGCHTF